MRILTVGGRAIWVAVRQGNQGWPPLLLCKGIGWTSLPLLPQLRPPNLIQAGDPIIPLANARIMHRLTPRSH